MMTGAMIGLGRLSRIPKASSNAPSLTHAFEMWRPSNVTAPPRLVAHGLTPRPGIIHCLARRYQAPSGIG
jgi:hypothetical protein